jgi:LacI family transcriptional regulator
MSEVTGRVKLTQKEIAAQLGVSRQLVGFALSGQGKVAQDTRERILEVARQNGYDQFSNSEARLMISRRYGNHVSTGLLTVLFPANFEDQPLSMVPFFTPIFRGLELEAKAQGHDLMLCPLREGELPRLVKDKRLDGVICLSTPQSVSRAIAALDLPLVNVQCDVEGIPSLLRDDFGGGLLATRHLIELGHSRIAYLGYNAPSGVIRLSAFHQALQEHDIAAYDAWIDATLDEPSQKAGDAAMRALLKKNRGLGVSALVAHNDLIAMGAIRALEDAGFNVPADVSVIGFDDVAEQYSFRPSLTSICFAREEMGRLAIRLLMEIAEKRVVPMPRGHASCKEVFPTRLVARDSTRAFQG